MLVRGVRSFVATESGTKYRVTMGQVLELPLNADWLRAGLVELVKQAGPVEPAPEPVVKRRRKGESNGG